MAALDPRIEVIRERYGLAREDFWELPQKKGTWVAKHSALEVAAAKANVLFDNPMIIEANTEAGIAVISVAGTMGDRREWATGEASPKNNKNAYPWAMAEKRAKDRVILKLIGIHGLVYSEDEMADSGMDARQQAADEVSRDAGYNPPPKNPNAIPKSKARAVDGEMREEINACSTVDELKTLWRSKPFQAEYNKHPADWQQSLIDYFNERITDLTPKPVVPGYQPPNFDHLADASAQ